MQNKKKVWVQGFSHIMLGLAEPEHGKAFYEKETLRIAWSEAFTFKPRKGNNGLRRRGDQGFRQSADQELGPRSKYPFLA